MKSRRRVLREALLGTLGMFAVGCAVTAWIVARTAADAQAVRDSQFRKSSAQLRQEVASRLTVPAYGLGGLRGMVLSIQRRPTPDEFRRAVLARDLVREFPGVYGFGFIEPVSGNERAAFVARTQAWYAQPFAVRTSGDPQQLYVIRSIEPIERNAAALGLDVGAEPVRREAVLRALASGAFTATGPIHLMQGGGSQFGALYFLPVFAPGPARELLGLVYAAVEYPRMLHSLVGDERLVDFTLADITTPTSVTVYPSMDQAPPAYRSHYQREVELTVGGRHLRLVVRSTPAFDAAVANDAAQARRLGLAGGVLSLLIAAVTWLLIAGRQRALDLAHSMTLELDRLATVARLTSNAVAIITVDGRVAWSNPAFTRLVGHAADDVQGRLLCDLLGEQPHADDACAAVKRAVQEVVPFQGEAPMRDRHGEPLWVELEVQPVRGRDVQLTSFIVILANITERRAMEDELRESRGFLQRTGDVARVGGWRVDLATRATTWSEQARRIVDMPAAYVPGFGSTMALFSEEARVRLQAALERATRGGGGWDMELPCTTFSGRAIWVRTLGEVETEHGRPVRITGSLQDITRRKQAELALAENRELLRVTLHSIGDAVVTTDAQAHVTWLNPVAETLTGWRVDEAVGRPIGEVLRLLSEETHHAVINPVETALAERRIVGLAHNTVLVARDGREFGIEDSAAPIKDDDGTVRGAVLVFHDVTAARALSREISHQARHDALTGLPNRTEYKERVMRFLRRAGDEGEHGAVLFVDLDNFKIVNDTCGHHAGDEVLVQMASLMRACVRSHDTVARLGGDEFAVLLEGCPREQAEHIAQAICDAADDYRYVAGTGQGFRVGASIGLVPIAGAMYELDAVMRAADISCYIAKSAGRGRVHTWAAQDASVQAHAGDAAWGARIEQALDQHGFVLYAQRIQPVSGHADRHGWHAEVLLRMLGEDGEPVSPAAFMPAAERYQLASRIDRWVVQTVFDLLSDWHDRADMPAMLSINLSGQSIGDRAFHDFVGGLIERARFDVRRLCFEITETAAITNLAVARAFLEAMRSRGIRIALDDFGAGVASFGYLKYLDVDYLKIDGQFVLGLASDPLDQVSVRSFCEVARVLGIQTIAECVERDELLSILATFPVDFAQGYLFHRPEPLAQLFGVQVAAGA
ncbi:EAL domain-containing protein [Dyella ginsengisoli]|uniref:EAL domain-containing protein n=1 Tax=Dyella ginsengisoli TaxID=363848 RepID=A0ABW8JPP5_9GAMM